MILEGCTAVAQNFEGSGSTINASARIRHIHSSLLWGEVMATVGSDPSLSGKVVKNFSEDSFVAVTASTLALYSIPSVNVYVGHRMAEKVTGYLEWDSGIFSSWSQGFLNLTSPHSSVGLIREHSGLEIDLSVFSEWEGMGACMTAEKSFEKAVIFGRDVKIMSKFKIHTVNCSQYIVGFDKALGDYGKLGFQMDTSEEGVFLKFTYLLSACLSLGVLVMDSDSRYQ